MIALVFQLDRDSHYFGASVALDLDIAASDLEELWKLRKGY